MAKAKATEAEDQGPTIHEFIEDLGNGEGNFTAGLKQALHAIAGDAGKAPMFPALAAALDGEGGDG